MDGTQSKGLIRLVQQQGAVDPQRCRSGRARALGRGRCGLPALGAHLLTPAGAHLPTAGLTAFVGSDGVAPTYPRLLQASLIALARSRLLLSPRARLLLTSLLARLASGLLPTQVRPLGGPLLASGLFASGLRALVSRLLSCDQRPAGNESSLPGSAQTPFLLVATAPFSAPIGPHPGDCQSLTGDPPLFLRSLRPRQLQGVETLLFVALTFALFLASLLPQLLEPLFPALLVPLTLATFPKAGLILFDQVRHRSGTQLSEVHGEQT